MSEGTCSIDGCDKPHRARGWCTKHYQRWTIHGDPLSGASRSPAIGPCTVTGCDQAAIIRGWCSKHYQRWRVHGDPERQGPTIEDRYWAAVDRSGGPDACWPWTGAKNTNGYGRFWDGHGQVGATRWGYARFVEPIPAGLWVLHRCDNPPCMNFAHWFTGTPADNSADRDAKGRNGSWKTAGDANWTRRHPERVAQGEAVYGAKLTEDLVRLIRAEYATGRFTQYELAARFGTDQGSVSRIVRHKLWKCA